MNQPLVAQLVERWTVAVKVQKSIGRWFKSGPEDVFCLLQILPWYNTSSNFGQGIVQFRYVLGPKIVFKLHMFPQLNGFAR